MYIYIVGDCDPKTQRDTTLRNYNFQRNILYSYQLFGANFKTGSKRKSFVVGTYI